MINEKQVIDYYNNSINQHIVELEKEDEYEAALYYKEGNFYKIKSVKEDGDNIILTTNKKIKWEDDAEFILCYAFGFHFCWKYSYKGKTITCSKADVYTAVK